MIKLAKPYNPGDIDPDVTYQFVRVFSVTGKRPQNPDEPGGRVLRIVAEFGNMEDGKWKPGKLPMTNVYGNGEDIQPIDDVVIKKDTPAFEGWFRACEQFLINTKVYDGTVVES